MATLNFNVNNNLKDNNGSDDSRYETVAPGWYHAGAIGSEMKTTRAGNGQYLNVQFEITEKGKFEGRYVWDLFNFENPNPKAVEIGLENFAKFCNAAGLNGMVTDSYQTHHRPVRIRVVNEEYQGEARAKIKGYRAADMTAKAAESNAPF